MSESESRLFLVDELPGFTPQIGRLVSMMRYVRHTTLADAAGLGVEQLDYLHDPTSNSIGALLLHIAAVEVAYQAITFHRRDLTEEEENEWNGALDLGDKARRGIRGHGLNYYVKRLEGVRADTLAEFARRNDDWLAEQTPFWGGRRANNHFKWFHVLEDELNHRGQIRWLKTRALRDSA